MFTCAFTGHRPARFSFGYREDSDDFLKLRAVLFETIEMFILSGVTKFYSGMSLGVDTWAAMGVLEKKKEHPHIHLAAVLPCETQAIRWSDAQRERYYNILADCDDVFMLNTRYTPSCMFERNRYMVDHADYLIAVYDGGNRGGTAYTVKYAKTKNRKISLIHPDVPEVVSTIDFEIFR